MSLSMTIKELLLVSLRMKLCMSKFESVHVYKYLDIVR
jgi:hypothetical protein